MKKWVIRTLPIIYLGMIWLQSSVFNPSSVAAQPMLGDALELGHLILFAVLYILIFLALQTYGHVTAARQIMAIFISFLCALIDEIHQYYVPVRSFSYVDLWKDAAGILVAWGVVFAIVKNGKLKKKY